jgi:hypothetical protein
VCIYNNWTQQTQDLRGTRCNNNADTLGLGSRLLYGGEGKTDLATVLRDGPKRYIAVYGRRQEIRGLFKIRVATGCTPPKQDDADWDKNFTTTDGSAGRRLRLPGGNGYYVNDEPLTTPAGDADDDPGKVTACARVFTNSSIDSACSYECNDGFVPGADIRCIVLNNSLPGKLTSATCAKPSAPEPEPEPEPAPEPEPEPQPGSGSGSWASETAPELVMEPAPYVSYIQPRPKSVSSEIGRASSATDLDPAAPYSARELRFLQAKLDAEKQRDSAEKRFREMELVLMAMAAPSATAASVLNTSGSSK